MQLDDLYLLGGNDGHQWLDLVDILSPDVRRWHYGTPMPSARGYGAAAAIGRHLFMVGGGNGAAWLNTTIMLDPTHGWQEVRLMQAILLPMPVIESMATAYRGLTARTTASSNEYLALQASH